MTTDERFEHMERNLAAVSDAIMARAQLALGNEEALKRLASGWELAQANMQNLSGAVERLTDGQQSLVDAHKSLVEAHKGLVEAHKRTEESLQRYIEAADARMRQMEANLDALIRIITAEHSNGRGQLGK